MGDLQHGVVPDGKPAPGELDVVRRFVNTLDVETGEDQLVDAPSLSRWLTDQGLLEQATRGGDDAEAELAAAVALREALRALLLAHTERRPPPADALRVLDDVARQAEVRLRFGPEDLSRLRAARPGVLGALGTLLSIVHRAGAEGTWSRLKACREPTCEWAFYDSTRNRSGTWCTMEVCGNRTKARTYRRRQAQS